MSAPGTWIGQAELARRIGISRQALHKLETGVSQPNVATALLLGRELGCSVEQLFAIDTPTSRIDCEGELREGDRVIVTRIANRWVAHALDELNGRSRADGVVRGPGLARDRWSVQTTIELEKLAGTLVIAGCAPGLGIVVELAREVGLRISWLPCDSGRALALLAQRRVHLAGLHLFDDASEQYNAPQVRRVIPRAGLMAFTRWSAGLAIATGNPLSITPARLGRRSELRVARRQAGSGATSLLQRRLAGAQKLRGPSARDHTDVARLIQADAADMGITVEAIARASGLDFIPLADERFDLSGAAETFDDPRVTRLADLLQRPSARAEFAPYAGEDARDAGHLTLV